MPTDDVYNLLVKQCSGMTYISETDSALTAFQLVDRPASPLDVNHFRSSFNIAPLASISQIDFDVWFDHEIAIHPKAGWSELRAIFAKQTQQKTIFRVGGTSCTYYIVGLIDGNPIGVKFNAVET